MDPVSQFKFACPVCGQHLQAKVEEVGRTTECPSCFKKLTVPQAPTESGTKLLITAALADARRSSNPDHFASAPSPVQPVASKQPWVYILLAILAVVVAVIAVKLNPMKSRGDEAVQLDLWTDKAYELKLFDALAVGRLERRDFRLASALWKDTTLILEQGGGQPDALSLRITFPLRGGELVPGKTFQLGPNDTPFDVPIKITWRNNSGGRESRIVRSRYILRVEFDTVSKKTVAGRIHLCILDPDRSWVAGSFSATNMTKIK